MTQNAQAPAKKGPFFFGWFVVAGGFMLMATCYTMFVNCIPLFQPEIISDPTNNIDNVDTFNLGVTFFYLIVLNL